MMASMEVILKGRKIPFSKDGNRIRYVCWPCQVRAGSPELPTFRCFPHIINLVAQAIIDALNDTPVPIPESDLLNASSQSSQSSSADDPEILYALAVASNPVGLARNIVAGCRASGQRREELQRVIKVGNNETLFSHKLPEHQLLRDCPTRWSSTFCMAQRFYELHEVRDHLSSPTYDLPCSIGHLSVPQAETDEGPQIYQGTETDKGSQNNNAGRVPTRGPP